MHRTSHPLQTSEIFLDKISIYFSLAAIIISFIIPSNGTGINMCYIKWLFDLPGPGCGLSRSISSISHLKFSQSFMYHPFGFIVYPVLVFLALYNFFPVKLRIKVKTLLRENNRPLGTFYLILVYSFLLHGIIRIIAAYITAR